MARTCRGEADKYWKNKKIKNLYFLFKLYFCISANMLLNAFTYHCISTKMGGFISMIPHPFFCSDWCGAALGFGVHFFV